MPTAAPHYPTTVLELCRRYVGAGIARLPRGCCELCGAGRNVSRWMGHGPLSLVMMAEDSAEILNSFAANLSTAVKGAFSGTLITLYGSFGSEVRVILNST